MTEPATPQHETTDKPWRVRLICCGRDDGTAHFATRGEAEVMRSSYIAAEGHDRAAIITGPADQQRQDTADTLAEYLTAMLADNGMRNVVSDCLRLVAALRGERDRQWQLKEIAQGELASAQLNAEQIRRLAEWPATITALPAEIAQTLRYHALQLVRVLGTGGPQRAPQRHAGGPAAAETDTQP